jgi:hypothetical protein
MVGWIIFIRMRSRVARRAWARDAVRMGESTIAGSWYHDDMSAAEAARDKRETRAEGEGGWWAGRAVVVEEE